MLSAETKHRAERGQGHLTAAEVGVKKHWPGAEVMGLPTVTAAGPIVFAQVNQGRWIIQCPWCPSAEYASIEDHRFFCTDCINGPVGGAWLPVHWPDDVNLIEQLLAVRPRRARNWLPGETVDHLVEENMTLLGGR